MKNIVHYDSSRGIARGPYGGHIVWPVDHPDSDNVSNASYVLTSTVLNWDRETNVFETENTIYKPIKS